MPITVFGGTTSAIYRQFSMTIIMTLMVLFMALIVLSVLVVMVFTLALCATPFKHLPGGQHHGRRGFAFSVG
ncbi:hypothetical protein [Sodalis-like endosymbiont of Proechinophthirus fluctus]|uniref:hypothetical protein n=1 Tax=Sodalis-like endosymbiont of Proechinophthirus fluctus TaxID=1462730 RepID=UPI000AE3EA6A|nr:hypothetical protein [Sodalis-like endosymbiont of Proechinophthirus fluctus]